MNNFTVCALYTPDYKDIISKLENDCKKLKYNYNFYEVPKDNYLDVCKLKITYWKKAIESFGTIIWLDADARILKKIPQRWIEGVSLARYHKNDKLIINHTTKNTKEKQQIKLKYFLGGFGILNESMLPIINKTLEYIDDFWEDEGLFNYICDMYGELLPEHLDIPYYDRWDFPENELILSEKSPHIVKGYTENNKAIIVFDELHVLTRNKTILTEAPIYDYKGAPMYNKKNKDWYNKNKMFVLYYPYSFNISITTTIKHMNQNYDDIKQLNRIYTKFCRLFKVEKINWYESIDDISFNSYGWYFNIKTKEYNPISYRFLARNRVPFNL